MYRQLPSMANESQRSRRFGRCCDARIEQLNPRLNAFCGVLTDDVLVAAKRSDETIQCGAVRALAGVRLYFQRTLKSDHSPAWLGVPQAFD